MCRQRQDGANSLRDEVQRRDRCRAAQRPACAQRQRGFTLLEAVVAMVLISGAGAALFAWINSELGALARVQDGVSYPRGVSLYQLALYDNYVTVQQTDGTRWFDFTLRQVGYKRVREIKFF